MENSGKLIQFVPNYFWLEVKISIQCLANEMPQAPKSNAKFKF
jgi:hypothetical protein